MISLKTQHHCYELLFFISLFLCLRMTDRIGHFIFALNMREITDIFQDFASVLRSPRSEENLVKL